MKINEFFRLIGVTPKWGNPPINTEKKEKAGTDEKSSPTPENAQDKESDK